MDWARILAFVTGVVDQELLARNEYLAAENRILMAKLKGRLRGRSRAKLVCRSDMTQGPPGVLEHPRQPSLIAELGAYS